MMTEDQTTKQTGSRRKTCWDAALPIKLWKSFWLVLRQRRTNLSTRGQLRRVKT